MASILVVDDCSLFRSVVRCYLTSLGHQVREAVDGVQGVKAYKAEPADVVLLDVYMPEQDGVETLRALLQYDSKARVIAVSGGGVYGNMIVLQQLAVLGAHTTLGKPTTLLGLKSAVEETLGYDSGMEFPVSGVECQVLEHVKQ